MPQILVPGVAQAVETGTVGGHPFALVWHFKQDIAGQNWSGAQLNSLSQAIHANIGTFICPLTAGDVSFNANESVDLGVTNPFTGASTPGAHVGAATGGDPPPSTCVLVSFQTLSRYRGGHPRTYMPPMPITQMTPSEDQWVAAAVSGYATAFANMMDGVLSANTGIFHCAVQYNYNYIDDTVHHKYHKQRASLKDVLQVSNWIPKAPLATQRRRISIGG